MKNIKKIIISAAILTIISVCTACGENDNAQTSKTENSTESSALATVSDTASDVSDDIQSGVQSSDEVSKDDTMQAVDERLQNLMQANDFKSSSEQNKLEAVETLLNELVNEGLIEDGSISYDAATSTFSFQYKSGALGGIMIKEFADNIN